MTTQRILARVAALLRAWIDAEQASGWAFARRIPSTFTWKIVDYHWKLSEERRSSLFAAFVSIALPSIGPSGEPLEAGYGDPEYRAMVDALPLIGGWEYANVRGLRSWLVVRRSGRAAAASSMPPEVVRRAEAIRPTSSREIRAAVAKVFRERFGARPENLGAGEWRYAGACGNRPFAVSIDYGGWDQLRYEIEYHDARTGLQARRVSWERLVGAGLGHWDSLTADNLQASVELLGDLVERVVTLPDRLDPERADG